MNCNNMRIVTSILILTLLQVTFGKRISKTLKLKQFAREGPYVFMTKMMLGEGFAQVDIEYRKSGQISSQSFYGDISVGVVSQQKYHQFTMVPHCLEKEERLVKKQKFNFRQERQGMKHFKMFDLPRSSLMYFYLYSCRYKLEEMSHNQEEIRFEFVVLNNGSHFQQNDYTLAAYIGLFSLWFAMIIRYAIPIVAIMSLKNPGQVKIIVIVGFALLGIAYIYRFIHLMVYWGDGGGVHVFQVFYLLLKNVGEAIISTLLIAIAWGWSIVHLKPSQHYIILGVVSGLINVVSLIVSSLAQEHEHLHHIYDTVPGIVVLVLRVLLLLVFCLGILNNLRQTSGKVKHFLFRVGLIGAVYFTIWPLTVFLVELLIPVQWHRNIITFVQQLVHICACTILCHMISFQQSAYRKVSLHQDDNPLKMPDYKHR